MSDRCIVLIEDDAGDAYLVTDMLVDVAPDVRVVQFRTLTAALDDWPASPECVLLDLGLPDAMGLSALTALQARVPDVPVVVLTGRSDDGLGPEALASGAQDFLVKGRVDGPQLERSLRYAVERSRATAYQRDLVAAELRAEENTRLQRGLLPSPLLSSDDLTVSPFYRPGDSRALLGGDFYDVVQTPTGTHLLVGDVSGHGPDEAALGVALRIAWRSLVLAGLDTAGVLRGVEQVLLAERADDERFATVAMVSVAPDLSRADVVLCGHPSPVLLCDDGVVELAAEPLPVLTMLDGADLAPRSFALPERWGLLLFTDGLVEGTAEPGASERLGAARLVEHLGALGDVARSDVAPALLAEAERRHGGLLPDDVAVLLVGSSGWWR